MGEARERVEVLKAPALHTKETGVEVSDYEGGGEIIGLYAISASDIHVRHGICLKFYLRIVVRYKQLVVWLVACYFSFTCIRAISLPALSHPLNRLLRHSRKHRHRIQRALNFHRLPTLIHDLLVGKRLPLPAIPKSRQINAHPPHIRP